MSGSSVRCSIVVAIRTTSVYKNISYIHKRGYTYDDESGRLNLQDRKMQDWIMTDKSAGLEFAGLENDGQKCRAGKCRTGK